METLKSPETLGEGLVISELGQAQNHCNETLEEVSELAVSVERCTGPVSPPVCSVEENACRIDSGSKVELYKNGISLFVELNGCVQGGSSIDLVKNVLPGNNSDQENRWEVNGSSSPNYSMTLMESMTEVDGGEAIGAEECLFAVDDLVWAKTKPQLWSPGVIYDPSNVPKDATKREQGNGLLVRCFGNGSFVWCLPSQLKPFFKNFEQMSRQSSSKSFFGAIEKAVAEVGWRVKMEMTCSCSALDGKRGNFAEFSINQFEPASFIGRIKSLARDVSGPDKIETNVIQSRLSAFYRSIGHRQIPMHQLKQANEANDAAEASDGIKLENKDEELMKLFGEDTFSTSKTTSVSSKSRKSKVLSFKNGDRSSGGKSGRKRRKSRYLSYPYVNSLGQKRSGEDGIEDIKTVSPAAVDTKILNSQSGGSTSINCDGKKSQRKSMRKTSTGNDVSEKPVQFNGSSSDVLSELQFTAIDCMHPCGNKRFGSTERFISEFRKSTFQDFLSEIACEQATGQELDHEMHPSKTLPEVEVQSDKGMASTLDVGGNDPVKQSLSNGLPKKRARKKKEKVLDSNSFPTSISPGRTCGPMMIDFQNVAPEAPGADQGLRHIELMPLDGNSTILNFGDSQVIGPPLGKLQPKRRKKKGDAINFVNGAKVGGSLLQEVKVMGPCSIQTIPELNAKRGLKESVSMHLNFEAPAGQTDITENNAGESHSQIGNLSPACNLEPMKRKRKGKAPGLQNNVASAIPDLNRIGAEGKLQKRKRKRINKAEACIDYNKLQNNVEVSGTTLLLKFAPGRPLPLKEALVSAFCGFGPVKEPETRVLEDSDIAQVVFESSSHALDAFRSLEKNSPFGHALVNFQLHNFSGVACQGLEGSKTLSTKVSRGKPPPQKEGQDLPGIRKNLEMMTSMLEKAGNNLSPEMRVKLENEVKGLLKKVSDMVGSSS